MDRVWLWVGCLICFGFVVEGQYSDSQRLSHLYKANNGRHWKNKENWMDTTVSTCEWFGVTCDANNETTALRLPNNYVQDYLNGYIFDGWDSLVYLDLSNNYFGYYPMPGFNALHLQQLGMYNSGFEGSMPTEYGSITSLVLLEMGGNYLRGTIPTEYGNLGQLETLDMHRSDMTTTIPTELGNCISLTNLNLYDNSMVGSVPTELGNLVNLQNLTLGGDDNHFDGTFPSELGRLENLLSLDLSNSLTGTLPSEIGNLVSLTLFDVHSNQHSGSVPSEVGNMKNLVTFDAHSSHFNGVLDQFICNATSIDLHHSQFLCPLPYCCFHDNNVNCGAVCILN